MLKPLAVVVTLSLTGLAHAQQWPGKPVRAIVNVAAGGVALRRAGGDARELLAREAAEDRRVPEEVEHAGGAARGHRDGLHIHAGDCGARPPPRLEADQSRAPRRR